MTKKVVEKDNVLFVPISKKMGKDLGFGAGSHVKVTKEGYQLIITAKPSKDDDFTEDELDKIESLAKEKGGKSFKTGKAFLKYLDKISKR